jgi:hypothetical protein
MGFGDLFVHSVGMARFTFVCFLALMAQADKHGPHAWLRVAAAVAVIMMSAGLTRPAAFRRPQAFRLCPISSR